MRLGCIADDLTGATDLALMLSREGLRTVQTIGVPDRASTSVDADAVVVALKSRTNPVREAIELSLSAAETLRAQGARNLFFKYCSTFDSTDEGNIGPVAEELLRFRRRRLHAGLPGFPGERPHGLPGPSLRERRAAAREPHEGPPAHPHAGFEPRARAPAADDALGRARGVRGRGRGRRGGAGGVQARARGRASGRRRRCADDRHLRTIGLAAADLALITGGSGVAMGLPEAFQADGTAAAAAGTQGFAAPARARRDPRGAPARPPPASRSRSRRRPACRRSGSTRWRLPPAP
jgi:hypothetical protein